MMRLVKRISSWKIVPIVWTLLTIFLLCLPGSDIPSQGVFSTPGIDKVVHVTLFGGIVLLGGFSLYFRRYEKTKWRYIIVVLTLFSIALGIGLEFLQKYYISNRSFDIFDMCADAAGALLAAIYHLNAKVK